MVQVIRKFSILYFLSNSREIRVHISNKVFQKISAKINLRDSVDKIVFYLGR